MAPPPIPSAQLANAAETIPKGEVAFLICAVVIVVALFPVAYAILALWEGERLSLRPASVASITGGRVVLTGVVEPAWAVATSPFGEEACVWYDARSSISGGRGVTVTLFRELNAVPFVLNDGTGRILVLARRARWDPATGLVAKTMGTGQDTAVYEGASNAEMSRLLDGAHQKAPYPLKSDINDRFSQEQIDANGTERSVLVGERVTVVGRAIPYSASLIKEEDACTDGGQSLGLTATYVIGAGPIVTGLDVLAGTPDDVTKRAWVHLLFGIVGAASILVAVIALLNPPGA